MKTIAVVGASASRYKFGNKCVRAYRDAGYQVYPVNPTEREIEGLPVCRTLAEVPAPLDRISVYLPPPRTLSLLPAIASAVSASGTEVWFNPGSADAAVLAEARRLGINARWGARRSLTPLDRVFRTPAGVISDACSRVRGRPVSGLSRPVLAARLGAPFGDCRSALLGSPMS